MKDIFPGTLIVKSGRAVLVIMMDRFGCAIVLETGHPNARPRPGVHRINPGAEWINIIRQRQMATERYWVVIDLPAPLAGDDTDTPDGSLLP